MRTIASKTACGYMHLQYLDHCVSASGGTLPYSSFYNSSTICVEQMLQKSLKLKRNIQLFHS